MPANRFPRCSRYNAIAPGNRPRAVPLRYNRTAQRAAPPGYRKTTQTPSAAPCQDRWQAKAPPSILPAGRRNELKDCGTYLMDIVQRKPSERSVHRVWISERFLWCWCCLWRPGNFHWTYIAMDLSQIDPPVGWLGTARLIVDL